MGVEPPFIYDKPSSYAFDGPTNRGFNPKAVTQASWTPKAPKVKQDGPLINFNRHPDSYYQSPYGNIGAKPMDPGTGDRVRRAWKTQLAFRISGLIGAIGALVCIILIRKTSVPVGWIIRVAPAVAFGHMVYGTYFMSKSPNSRPPMSCASYHIFSTMLDVGLIPFFVFTGYLAWNDSHTNAYGWGTVINDNFIDYKVILSLFTCSLVTGSFCSVSLVLDIYLAGMFRKIMTLPPDMNPLEESDNLTARPRHKRNKSELTHDKHLTSSTLAAQRGSQVQSGRRVPYMHSRTDSADSGTLCGSEYGKDNRPSTPKGNSMSPSRPASAVMPSPTSRSPGRGLDHKPLRSSTLADRPTSWLSYSNYEGVPAEMSDYAQRELETHIRSMSPVSAVSNDDEGITHDQFHDGLAARSGPAYMAGDENIAPSSQNRYLAAPTQPTSPKKRSPDPLGMNPPTPTNRSLSPADFNPHDESLIVRPLSIASHGTPQRPGSGSAYHTPARQPLRETNNNNNMTTPTAHSANATYAIETPQTGAPQYFETPASRPRPSTSRPSSFIGSGGKSRYYGNLRASIGPTSPSRVESNHSFEPNDDAGNVYRSNTQKTASSANFEVYGSDSDDEQLDHSGDADQSHTFRDGVAQAEEIEYDPFSSEHGTHKHHYPGEQAFDEHPEHHTHDVEREIHETHAKLVAADTSSSTRWNGQRQVSNSTGYDLHEGYAGLGAEFGRGMAARRREVSGKIAEEGRADGGAAAAAKRRQGAAGWERFRGY